MQNDRPIESPRLRKALREIQQIMARHDLAGAVMLVNDSESAFTYGLPATWSAWRAEPQTPLGVRLYAKSAEEGHDKTHRKVEGAVHTICQLSDFGVQTWQWMEQLKRMVSAAGIEFDHVSFGGKKLPDIVGLSRDAAGSLSLINTEEKPKQ